MAVTLHQQGLTYRERDGAKGYHGNRKKQKERSSREKKNVQKEKKIVEVVFFFLLCCKEDIQCGSAPLCKGEIV